jgi:protein-L-isoaspartate(D-aspartate) O-methyltransferase
MVERQLRRRGIVDELVLAAMGEVPRDEFVPVELLRRAYADSALPIGEEQTISQPWVVAAICQALALQGGERVLEVGTGSGYSAAVLARMGARVFSVERSPVLARRAASTLERLGVTGVEVIEGDGSGGLPEEAPFEAIAVHAAAPAAPASMLSQLAEGGRLVVPIAERRADVLTVFRRAPGGFAREEIGPCRFVPLLGEEGFSP